MYAVGKGAFVAIAMGNEFEDGNPVEYPAAYPDVIAVGAVTQANRRASFSNTGKHIALCAPGVAILSTLPMKPSAYRSADETQYAAWDGTSMATPFVTGSAALVAAKNSGSVTPAGVLARLTATASRPPDMGAASRSVDYGAGVLNLDAALAKKIRRRSKRRRSGKK
jgi:subtilisin family serine protease